MKQLISPLLISRTSTRSITMLVAIGLITLPGLLAAQTITADASTPKASHYAEIKSERIVALTTLLPDSASGFGLACSNRSAWENPLLRARLEPSIKQAEKLLQQTFPAWNDDDYLQYSRTGQRSAGEKMMNARKNWLYPLVIAECLENKGRFLDKISLVLTSLSEQKSWTAPAHDAKLLNFSGREYYVDLTAAHLGKELAQAVYMLGDMLPGTVQATTQLALKKRVFDPVMKSFINGKGENWWLTADHNWNAVCLAGVVGAALTILPDTSERAIYAAAAEHYSNYYVSGFADDGYAAEGVGYWNYGFSNYASLRETIWQATGGTLDLFKQNKIREVALFGARIEMMPGSSAAFGDVVAGTKPNRATLVYLNKALQLGLKSHDEPLLIVPNDLSNTAMALFPNSTTSQTVPAKATPTESIGIRSYFDKAGVLVARPGASSTSRLAVTMKAGGNANHSHNDVGSYVLALGSEQITGDPGGLRFYDNKTFGKTRYQSKVINSFGHPVPVVDGKLQKEANKIAIKVLSTNFTDERDQMTIDMAPAYAVPDIITLERALTYDRTGLGSVEIEDRFAFQSPHSMEVALITRGQWSQRDAVTIELMQGAEKIVAVIQAPGEVEVFEEKIKENGTEFTRLGIRLKKVFASGTIRLRFVPG